jgi:DhnA family fructose-bisphosphate aldolase class Ia
MQASQIVAMWSDNYRDAISFVINLDDSDNINYSDKKIFTATNDNGISLFSDDNSFILVVSSEENHFYLIMTD